MKTNRVHAGSVPGPAGFLPGFCRVFAGSDPLQPGPVTLAIPLKFASSAPSEAKENPSVFAPKPQNQPIAAKHPQIIRKLSANYPQNIRKFAAIFHLSLNRKI